MYVRHKPSSYQPNPEKTYSNEPTQRGLRSTLRQQQCQQARRAMIWMRILPSKLYSGSGSMCVLYVKRWPWWNFMIVLAHPAENLAFAAEICVEAFYAASHKRFYGVQCMGGFWGGWKIIFQSREEQTRNIRTCVRFCFGRMCNMYIWVNVCVWLLCVFFAGDICVFAHCVLVLRCFVWRLSVWEVLRCGRGCTLNECIKKQQILWL